MKNRELRQRIAVLGALALTGAATMLAGCEKAEGTGSTTESTGISTEAVSSTEETTSVTETVTTEAVTTEAATKPQTVGNEAYNDIKLDEYSVESFEKLIKNTITYSRNQIFQFLSEDNPDKTYYSIISGTVSLFDDLYNGKIDINLDDECDFNNRYYDSTIDLNNYSYRDMAGIVGYYLFDSAIFNNYSNNVISNKSDCLENFVINNFINADIDKLSDFEILTNDNVYLHFNDDSMGIDVPMLYVKFNYSNDIYYACIGEWDNGYRVFDIIRNNSDNDIFTLTTNNEENVETTISIPEETTIATETSTEILETTTEIITEITTESTATNCGVDLTARPTDEKPGMYMDNWGSWVYYDGTDYYVWTQQFTFNSNCDLVAIGDPYWDNVGPHSPEENMISTPYDPNGPKNPYAY